jgi:hypothetical protein
VNNSYEKIICKSKNNLAGRSQAKPAAALRFALKPFDGFPEVLERFQATFAALKQARAK